MECNEVGLAARVVTAQGWWQVCYPTNSGWWLVESARRQTRTVLGFSWWTVIGGSHCGYVRKPSRSAVGAGACVGVLNVLWREWAGWA